VIILNNIFINLFFLLLSLYVLGKIIGYAMYEINIEKNLFGGICTIVFSVFSILIGNLMIAIHS
jgi:hypothetical protein